AEPFDEICACFDVHLSRSLRDVVFGGVGLDETGFTQPALFAVEVALFRLLESWGVRPDFVTGHSIGELAAAHVAGVLTLDDACRVVAARGRLMQALPAGGAMVAVQATEAEVVELLQGREREAGIAAVNGPSAVVISGVEDVVVAIADELRERGHKTNRLTVSHAFHSPLMDPVLDEFATVVNDVAFAEPEIPMAATAEEVCSARYWVDHVREPVRFADHLARLRAAGVTRFVEIGPDGVLTAMGPQTIGDASFTASQRRDRPQVHTAVTALAHLHTAGHPVDWSRLFTGTAATLTDLPTYAFQHRHYWMQRAAPAVAVQTPGAPSADRTYRIGWTPLVEDTPSSALSGTWLLIRPAHACPLADGVERALTEHGATVLRADDVAGLADTDPAGIVSLLGPGTTIDTATDGGLRATLRVVQDLIAAGTDVPLWILTSGAVAVGDSDPVRHPEQATLWGLGRAVAAEHPELGAARIDLPAELTDHTARLLCARLLARDEPEIAIRPAGVFARRLLRTGPTAERWSPTGTVLITGGTGALAGHVARWLAANGAEHLVLAGRRGPDGPEAGALHAELIAGGVRATIVRCDVTDRDSLRELLDEYKPRAVVHTAAVLDDGVIASLTPEQVDRVLGPKLLGARHLHELTRETDLDAFVLFSSLAGVLGGAGQAPYAAANAYLDALAAHRTAQGLPAASLAWGPWAGGGMADTRVVEDRLRRSGLTPLAPEEAVRALARAHGPVVVADVDWARLAAGARHRLLDELPDARPVVTPARDEQPDLLGRLVGCPVEEQSRVLLDAVRAEIAAVLRYDDPARIDPAHELLDLGFDSLTSIELRNRLVAGTGLTLPAMLTLEQRTPAALAEYLRERIAATAPAGPRSTASLDDLWHEADRHGRRLEFIDLLGSVADFRSAYRDPDDLDVPPLRLSSGGTDTPVFCIPSHLGKADPHKFLRFAAALRGRRDVFALREPGFVTGEPIPATLDVLLATHARALAEHDEVVLLGYSAGGLAAHALAVHLAALGRPPAALVLLDTYAPEQTEVMTRIQGAMEQGQRERDGRTGEALGEAWLTAMGRYFSFDWTPSPVEVPVLHVRAGDPMPQMPADGQWQARWHLPHIGTDVPGDHFTMMEQHAPRTADVVHDWLVTTAHRAGAEHSAHPPGVIPMR
ncbi:type I polyketide synthase, partial [Embleya sp. NPDC059259]|uniref:type I polyketide synthase n=2 Tax=Embleya TaxID=2699295 RepID=UPI00369E3786